jgi:hypothetical protein
MRDGPESKRPIVPDTWGYYGVVRLSNPSRTVFGSSPTLTTKKNKKYFTKCLVELKKLLIFVEDKWW